MTMLISSLMTIFLVTGCDHDDFFYYDDVPPSPPQNVWTITGDNRVDIFWDYNRESDVAGYNVYYNYTYEGRYTLLGSTIDNYFIDYGAENGVTYYYGIAAYDYNGNESELSYDVVYDTPRPEGFNQAVFDYTRYPSTSGYCFNEYLVTSFDDLATDFFFENYDGVFYLNVWDDTDIQDMGATNDIYDVTYAPLTGWVPLYNGDNVKYTEAIVGRTYVIWTWDNHFAKIRIKHITNERMVFDWAYQIADGNRELKRGAESSIRKEIPKQVQKNHGFGQ
ncbi:MAG: hypothetical protein A2V66_00110 [Ignavibacteria bacterium RBG_13_36_8]|nr:MAG: hypothetical protein A2V66_00110 [Ignavibacteria bacterium RBG_13_36_8]